MTSHKGHLAKAGIDFEDDRGRRVDLHALRHTYGSMLAKAGVAPRVAMSLMRHTDLRLTMNVYTDPRIFDLAGAVEALPAITAAKATGTEGNTIVGNSSSGRTKSVTTSSAQIGYGSASIGHPSDPGNLSLILCGDSDRQQKTPSGMDEVLKRVKGVEPSTFTLAT